MSHQYNGWGHNPHDNGRAPQPTDQSQPRYRLPPPRILASGAPDHFDPSYNNTRSHVQDEYHSPRHTPPLHDPSGHSYANGGSSTQPQQSQSYNHNAYHISSSNTSNHHREAKSYTSPYQTLPATHGHGHLGHETQDQRHYHQEYAQPLSYNRDSSYSSRNSQRELQEYPPPVSTFKPSHLPPTSSSRDLRRAGDDILPIPDLLHGGKVKALHAMVFRLAVRQQPKAARACGSGERDRRNIDPPPIVQLHIEAPGLTSEEVCIYLRYEAYVMNCAIYDESGENDASHMPSEYRHQRRLTGSQVGTPFFGKDENGTPGCFFPFSDLSVRTLGRYRLKFNLIMLDNTRPGQASHFPILTETFSEPFDVYTAKEFPGITESSRLVRTLKEQGCIISIKKGNDKKKKAKSPLESAEEDEEDERGGGGEPVTDEDYKKSKRLGA